jgi:hypothetical protein
MDLWLSNLSPLESYLIAGTALMLGAILFFGGIILLLEPRKMSDAEKLAAIRKVLERADEIGSHTHGGDSPEPRGKPL